jgi:hypothetical protein
MLMLGLDLSRPVNRRQYPAVAHEPNIAHKNGEHGGTDALVAPFCSHSIA